MRRRALPGRDPRAGCGIGSRPGAVLALALCVAVSACSKRPEAIEHARSAADVPPIEADPVLARVDLDEVRLSTVQERLGQIVHAENRQEAVVEALLLAVTDALVLREMAVLDQRPEPGERPWQAAERLLAAIWNPDGGCNLADDDLRWVWLRDLAKYKHPPSFTVWDAQLVCCEAAECPLVPTETCRKELRPLAERLASEARAAFAAMPALPADLTATSLDASPVRADRLPAFEALAARLQADEPRLRLRRYTFFQQGAEGFEKAPFRAADPALEQALADARPGDLVGPVDTHWGLDVVLLVAREPMRQAGLDSEAVRAEVRRTACEEVTARERAEYRQRLLSGAVLHWDRAAIQRAFGPEVVSALPPDASNRELPHIPAGL